MIKCEQCEHFLDKNSTVCCTLYKIGFKYNRNRLSTIYKLSKKCELNKEKQVSEFSGPITENTLKKFEEIYYDTSKPVMELMDEHKIHSQKWCAMASEIKKRTGYSRPRYDSTKNERYICKRKGAKQTYYIVKHNDKYYGSYKSLDEAIMARNLLESYEWNIKFLPYIRMRVSDYYSNMNVDV